METKTAQNKYCFDSDTLMVSWRSHYRPNVFGELWEKIGSKIEAGLILIPDEVRKEIGAGNDPLVTWLKKYASFIVPVSKEQGDIVRQIVNKYPLVSQYKKPRPNHADPFVIAVAKIYRCTVVTNEKASGNMQHPSIPELCREHGIACFTIADLFEKEKWHFNVR